MPFLTNQTLTVGRAAALLACAVVRSFAASSPYVIPANPAVKTQALLTVGESVNLKPDGVTPYRAVGIMDGLGAYDNGNGTFTLVMNHEIPVNISGTAATPVGAVRAHGNAGAFVSRWTIDKTTLQVIKVEDLLPNNTSIFLSNNNPSTGTVHSGYLAGGTTPLGRLCSADLAAPTAYAWTDPNTGTFYGTAARIFQTGEEMGGLATSIVGGGNLGPEGTVHYGRQWNMILTDDPNIPGDQSRTAYEMPHCGIFAWENNLASPFAQRKTIVAGMDDTSPGGQIYFWIGDKRTTGNVVERAGLTRQGSNDNLYVVKVEGLTPDASGATNEDRATPLNGPFALQNEGDVSGLTGAQLETLSNTKGGTKFLRPEDGSWDPRNPRDFYFVTTDRYDQVKDAAGATVGRSRLYRLRFADITNPELGGTITSLLDGTEAGNMFDNMTVDGHGRILIQEDVGGQPHNGKIWMYEIATGRLVLLAKHDPARFGDLDAPAVPPFNQDEESSGIIDLSGIVGPGAYLLDVQAHYSPGDVELVEGGQLVAMYVPVPPMIETVTLNDGSAQRSKVKEVTVKVDGVIPSANVAAGAFLLTRTEGGTSTVAVKSVTEVNGETFVKLGFTGTGVGSDGSLVDGSYTLNIVGSKITDQLGQALDSDQNGIAGGPTVTIANFKTLFGDLNGDGDISGQDVAASAHANGSKVGDVSYLWYLDYDADGVLAGEDHREVARRNNGKR